MTCHSENPKVDGDCQSENPKTDIDFSLRILNWILTVNLRILRFTCQSENPKLDTDCLRILS